MGTFNTSIREALKTVLNVNGQEAIYESTEDINSSEPCEETDVDLLPPILVDNIDQELFNKIKSDVPGPGIEYDDSARLYSIFANLLPEAANKKYLILNTRISISRMLTWMSNNTDKLVVSNGIFIVPETDFLGSSKCKAIPSTYALYKIEDDAYILKTSNSRGSGLMIHLVLVQSSPDRWTSDKYNALLKSFIVSCSVYEEPRAINRKAMDQLVLEDDIINDIQMDIDNFLVSRDLYIHKLKIPWKRGYMLIGPPGVGKTLLIKCICKCYNLKSVAINNLISSSGALRLADVSNMTWVEDAYLKTDPSPIVVVMEDIDKFIAFQGGEKGKDYSSISLHEVLRAMDGIEEINNVIVMATTNYGNVLSDALINRPGRFDRVFKIGLPSNECIAKFLEKREMQFKDTTVAEVAARLGGCSMAFVEEFVKSMKMMFKTVIFDRSQADLILEKIQQHNTLYEELTFKTKKVGFGSN